MEVIRLSKSQRSVWKILFSANIWPLRSSVYRVIKSNRSLSPASGEGGGLMCRPGFMLLDFHNSLKCVLWWWGTARRGHVGRLPSWEWELAKEKLDVYMVMMKARRYLIHTSSCPYMGIHIVGLRLCFCFSLYQLPAAVLFKKLSISVFMPSAVGFQGIDCICNFLNWILKMFQTSEQLSLQLQTM